MIKFILPNSYNNIDINQDIISENNYNNLFWGIETDLPFSIFNGRINNNRSQLFASYYDIINTINEYKEISNNMIIFDFGNCLLEKFDYEDCFGNIIFDEYANKQNAYFEIADINLINFLIKKYPAIQIILHENYTIFNSEQDIKEVIK